MGTNQIGNQNPMIIYCSKFHGTINSPQPVNYGFEPFSLLLPYNDRFPEDCKILCLISCLIFWFVMPILVVLALSLDFESWFTDPLLCLTGIFELSKFWTLIWGFSSDSKEPALVSSCNPRFLGILGPCIFSPEATKSLNDDSDNFVDVDECNTDTGSGACDQDNDGCVETANEIPGFETLSFNVSDTVVVVDDEDAVVVDGDADEIADTDDDPVAGINNDSGNDDNDDGCLLSGTGPGTSATGLRLGSLLVMWPWPAWDSKLWKYRKCVKLIFWHRSAFKQQLVREKHKFFFFFFSIQHQFMK